MLTSAICVNFYKITHCPLFTAWVSAASDQLPEGKSENSLTDAAPAIIGMVPISIRSAIITASARVENFMCNFLLALFVIFVF